MDEIRPHTVLVAPTHHELRWFPLVVRALNSSGHTLPSPPGSVEALVMAVAKFGVIPSQTVVPRCTQPIQRHPQLSSHELLRAAVRCREGIKAIVARLSGNAETFVMPARGLCRQTRRQHAARQVWEQMVGIWWLMPCDATASPARVSHIHDIAPPPLPSYLEVSHALSFHVASLALVLLEGLQSPLVLVSVPTKLPTSACVGILALIHELRFRAMRVVHVHTITTELLEHLREDRGRASHSGIPAR